MKGRTMPRLAPVFFQTELKEPLSKVFGGTMRLCAVVGREYVCQGGRGDETPHPCPNAFGRKRA